MIDDMQVYIANLGKYNEEELVGGVSTVQSRIYQGLRKLEKVLEREEFYDG